MLYYVFFVVVSCVICVVLCCVVFCFVLFCFVLLCLSYSLVVLGLFVGREIAVRPTCESKSACKFSKTDRKQAPTATGIGVSCRAREMLLKTGFDIEKGAWKVCFTAGTLCL